MKTLRTVLLTLAVAALVSAPTFAQTTINSTTASAAVSTTANTVLLASVANISVNDLIFIDQEAMRVRAINGSVLTVSRAAFGPLESHASGALVWTGPEQRFASGVPPRGVCTIGNETYAPRILLGSGDYWYCTNSVWTRYSPVPGNGGAVMPRAAMANASYTVLPTDYLIAITSLTGAKTITLPAASSMPPGKIIIIKDESGVLSTSASIVISASSGSIEAVSSITLSTPYTTLRYYAGATNWFAW